MQINNFSPLFSSKTFLILLLVWSFYLHLITFARYYLQYFSTGGLILLLPIILLETLSAANIQLFLCNANLHICTFSFSATPNVLCVWKSLLRVSSLRSTMAAIVDRRRLLSRVMQSCRVAVVLSGSEQWTPPVTVASPDRRLTYHVPRTTTITLLSLCRKLHCYLNDFSVIWNIPSVKRPHFFVLFAVVCLWLKLVDRGYFFFLFILI